MGISLIGQEYYSLLSCSELTAAVRHCCVRSGVYSYAPCGSSRFIKNSCSRGTLSSGLKSAPFLYISLHRPHHIAAPPASFPASDTDREGEKERARSQGNCKGEKSGRVSSTRDRSDGRGGEHEGQWRRQGLPVQAGVRVLRQQLGQAEQLPGRRRRARQGAGGAEGGFGVRRGQPGAHGGGVRGRAQGRRPCHRRDSDDSDGQGADGGDGGRGPGRVGHAPAQGRDGTQLRRLHRAPRRVRDAGRAPGGDHVGPARHPQQAGGPSERGRVLQPAAGVHRQGSGRRLHQAVSAQHLRQRTRRKGTRPETRGVRGGAGRGPRRAQAALGDRAGRLQLHHAGRDRSLADHHMDRSI